MELIIGNSISLLVGLITSYLFLRWQLSVKPQVEISSKVVYSNKSKMIKIKVMNKSKRQVTDVKGKLSIMRRFRSNNRNLQLIVKNLPFKNPEIIIIAGLTGRSKPWGMLYAQTFETVSDEDVLELLRTFSAPIEERRLVFTMEAVDAISGTKIVHRKAYKLDDIEIDGTFGKGLSIIKSDTSFLSELLLNNL